MDRDEQVGLRIARAHVALGQGHEGIAVADQHGLHAGISIDLAREFARDREGDFLFLHAGRPARAGILAAMPGVDRDDQFALARADHVL